MARDTSKLVTIPGELHSAATGNIVAAAEEVFDYTTNKYQKDINQEVAYIKEDSSVDPIPSFNPQSQTVHLDEQVLSNAQKKQVRKNIGFGNGDIDSTPTSGSDNVVRSGGVYSSMQELRSTVNPQVGYYTCSTAGDTAAKVIDASGYTLLKGGGLRVNFTEKNTAANATLNIEGTGAKPLYYNGVRVSTNNSWYAGEVMALFYDGAAFQCNSLPDTDEYDVSARNGGQAFTFEEAVNLVPEAYRHGGLKLRFISNSDGGQISDNKYVQYRLMADVWSTTETDWQGVDDEPTSGSDNLVKSGGVLNSFKDKIGGIFLSNIVPVFENTELMTGRYKTSIANGETINIKLLQTNLISGELTCSLWYGNGNNDREFVYLSSNNTTIVTVSHNITGISYYIYGSHVTGSGNIHIDFSVSEVYTKMEDFNKLENDVYNIQNEINGISPADVELGYIRGDGLIDIVEQGYQHYIIQIFPDDIIKLKPTSDTNTDYVLLKSYSPYIFCDSVQGRVRIAPGSEEQIITPPSDARFLVITKMYSGNAYGPQYVLINNKDAINGTADIETRIEQLENEQLISFLRYTSASNKFEMFTVIPGGRYASFIVTKDVDIENYKNVWRVTGGAIYDKNLNQIAISIISGENEHTAFYNGFGAFESATGGFHGGESVEGDSSCFVKFFADGKLITDTMMASDFEMDCQAFNYIEFTTLNKVKSGGDPISGTPIFAHHLKETSFNKGKMNCKNIIIYLDNVSAVRFFIGLFCLGKGAASYGLLPNGISQQFVGNTEYINCNDNLNSEFLFYNPTNNIFTKISSSLSRGIDLQQYNSSIVGKVWDRLYDSKYYYYIDDSHGISISNGDIIETQINIEFL